MRFFAPLLSVLLFGVCKVASGPTNEKFEYSGMSFTDERYCPNVSMGSEVSHDSLKHLKTTGTNYVGVVVTQYSENMNSTEIFRVDDPVSCTCTKTGYCKTATDEGVRTTIRQTHALGMSVMLKPHIDFLNDAPLHWRGNIGEHFTASDWDTWFEEYTRFILHYAHMAEEEGVKTFAVSTELITPSLQEAHWRKLIPLIRKAFSGELTSAANWSPAVGPGEVTDKMWWDLVDFIGVDQYYMKTNYSLVNGKFPTREELLLLWEPIEWQLHNLSTVWGKPVVFTEIGFCAGYNADCYANNGGLQPLLPNASSLDSQALQFEATMVAFGKHDWFKGVFWWNWNTGMIFFLKSKGNKIENNNHRRRIRWPQQQLHGP